MHDFPADVEYSEWGQGPALLLLPGSFGTGSGWKAVTDRLARSYRIVTTSLLGYGATAERRPLGNSTMRQQTEVIDRILERIGEPAHLVGHSFGGLAALAHAIEGAVKPASLDAGRGQSARPFEDIGGKRPLCNVRCDDAGLLCRVRSRPARRGAPRDRLLRRRRDLRRVSCESARLRRQDDARQHSRLVIRHAFRASTVRLPADRRIDACRARRRWPPGDDAHR